MSVIAVHAIITPKPEHVNDVQAEMLNMVRASRQEEGNLRYDLLREEYPDAHCELDYADAYQLAVATILSVALMLDWLGQPAAAQRIEQAVERVRTRL